MMSLVLQVFFCFQGSSVFDKCLQPHESHIPFILQFMVDYNLYGMGHLHVSKIKFHYPIPDVFVHRRSVYNGQPSQVIDKTTCTSAVLQTYMAICLWVHPFGYLPQFQLTGHGILLLNLKVPQIQALTALNVKVFVNLRAILL